MLTCSSCRSTNPAGAVFCNACGHRLDNGVVREERKVITALFCDIVGSTALSERLDPEDVAPLMRQYGAICRHCIESHGGVVEKFIGDAAVGVFGVPVAHEDDPERAVRAALRILDDVAASDLQIEVRIGVNTGEALVRLDVDPASGHGFVTGDAMNTAARLQSAAPVMGIAVGTTTYQASAESIVYRELPPLVAKGKAAPVPAWQAEQPRARIARTEDDHSAFVGRELEMTMLRQLFDRTQSRPATEFCTIISDPGLGKSRLVRELGRHVDQLSDLVIWREGRCLPYGDGISFWALGDIVKSHAGILETDDQPTVSAKLDQAITEPDPQTRNWLKDRLAPLVGLATSGGTPQREEVFTAWRRFIEQLAAGGPTVLVFEDIHWADPALVAFLEHLAARTAGLPLFVIVTARPEVEDRHPTWPPGRRSSVLSLSPLTDAEITELVVHALPDIDERLTQIVLERAGGSPLYAEQLATMLPELTASGAVLDDTMIPLSVQALIAARIDGLPPGPKQVLMEASVVGKTFWAGAVAALGEHEDLPGDLAELVRRDFCRPTQPSSMASDNEFIFWHALVRDVAYAEITRAERARMHATTARWLSSRAGESMRETAEIVVHHLDAALDLSVVAPDLDTGPLTDLLAGALIAAGQSAMRTEVPRAVPHLERALTLLADDDARRGQVLHLLARAYSATGDLQAATEALDRLLSRYRETGNVEEATATAIQLSGILWLMGEGARGDAIVQDTAGALSQTPSPALTEVLAYEAMSRWVSDDFEMGSQRAAEAIEVAKAIDVTPPLLAFAAGGMCRLSLGDPDGESDVRRAVTGFLEELNPGAACTWIFNLGSATRTARGPAAALGYFEESIALANRYGMDGEVWSGHAGRVECLTSLGKFDEVRRESPAIMERTMAHQDAYSRCVVLQSLAVMAGWCGQPEVDAGELADLARRMDDRGGLLAAAMAARTQGDNERARALALEGISHAPAGLALLVARTCVSVELLDEADEFLADVVAHYPAEQAATLAASAVLTEARGDYARAQESYLEAADLLQSLEMAPDLAYTWQGLGRCQLRLGERDAAIHRLGESRELWRSMSADPRVAEIDEVLVHGP